MTKLFSIAVAATLLTACTTASRPANVPPTTQAAPAVSTVAERYVSAETPQDELDSLATWPTEDGRTWLIASAKSTHRLVVFDADSGERLREVGKEGASPGEFDRPNGLAVYGDQLFVVERDNHRVQVLRLPGFEHVLTFAADDLVKPYGLWVNRVGEGYELYVTDSYDKGEDAQGNDILPPLAELDRRVHRYALDRDGDGFSARALGAFGDATPEGALRVVESVWGDAANDRLLIAEEDETYANELKVYDLAGKFSGRTIGRDVFKAQSEGIMLKTCADGGGWWITTEQGKGRTVFHLFDRRTLEHTGAVAGRTVANTDGIWLDQRASPRFPDGVLYAVHDDQGVAAIDWRDIAGALSLPACPR